MNIQSDDKKQRILDATMELIAENGLHATPMSQISKRSKVSAGTIYHYFSNKDELINYLYLELKKEMFDAAFLGYDLPTPYQKRFLLIWRNTFNFLISRPKHLSLIEQCTTSPLISEEVQEKTNRYLATALGFITEGIESGHLKKMDNQLILSLMYGSILSTVKLQFAGDLEITDEHREAAALFCWDGLKAN
ncbi:MAG: TetR/AcrR family transcriptional regulator [Cyanobacteria bacterium SBLK]|nr:TetR/AcrR family transcriptional regulator [Cyanobacteria bacterium SBLK]